MIDYSVRGMHCLDCAGNLEKKLQSSYPEGKVSIDYKHKKLIIDSSISNLPKIKKILEFEKIVVVEGETEDEKSEDDSEHHHGLSRTVLEGDTTRKIALVFYLNLFFALIEFIFGFLFNSMAIVSDAVHDLGDAFSVGAAGYFHKLSTKEANDQYSFGHQRFSLLGALLTSGVLFGGAGLVIFHSFFRVLNPEPVNYQGMLWLSLAAIAANGFSAWLMSKGKSKTENLLNLHMLEDLLGWIGVLIVSGILHFTDWYVLDPLLSIAVAIFILVRTWPLFKETVEIFLEATPHSVSRQAIEDEICSLPAVSNLSHLHIWSIDGNEHALTVTVSTDNSEVIEQEKLKEAIRRKLIDHSITHSTIEIVYDPEYFLINN
ncbi:cation diffusion facilitator family transporter [Alkalibacterium sp.]|nr:MAG: cation diffusion facilitator family transporter [Alkalibacterium sp.]